MESRGFFWSNRKDTFSRAVLPSNSKTTKPTSVGYNVKLKKKHGIRNAFCEEIKESASGKPSRYLIHLTARTFKERINAHVGKVFKINT